MNLKDAALLKYRNVQDDFIIFRRAKTNRTSRATSLPICVNLNENMREIMAKGGNKDTDPENFIFPF
jgi:integrase/recombinase XerD